VDYASAELPPARYPYARGVPWRAALDLGEKVLSPVLLHYLRSHGLA
jgi:hypothetical protein